MKPLFPFTLNRNSKQAKGLIYWGPGGHGSGNLFDFSGSFNNGHIVTATPNWVAGVDGGQTAIRYNGSIETDLVADVPVTSSGLTVSCWVKTSTTARYQYLMVHWGSPGGSDSWHMRIDVTTGFVYWTTSTSGSYTAARDLNGTTNVCDGKWHLITCTYDGVNEKIYVDAVLQATLAATGTLASVTGTPSFAGLSDNTAGANWLIGDMDEPRIYNYALPQNIITEMYHPITRWELRYKPKKTAFLKAGAVTSKSASNTLTIAQSVAAVNVLNRSVSNSLTITQSDVVVDHTQFVSNSLTITQTVVVRRPNQAASQSLTISQSATHAATLHLSVSNSLSILQSNAESKWKPRAISQSLTIAQVVAEVKTTGLSNSLSITQSATYQYDPHLELSAQLLVPTQTVAAVLDRPRTVTQSLTISQVVAKTKIITRSVTQSFTITQNVHNSVDTNPVSTLVVSQAVTKLVFRNNPIPTQHLTLHQAVSVSLILNRSLVSTLVFKTEHQIPDGSGGFINVPNLIYARGNGTDNSCCQGTRGSTVFQSATRAIVLPNPEFGDTENIVGAVSIKRTITGGTFSYVKKSSNRKLVYKFHIKQKKAFELRQFLLDFLAQRITLTNWKGEMWSGYFLSDPADITSIMRGEPCIGDLYEVELDFQGIRIN